jgi:hypothetical protein
LDYIGIIDGNVFTILLPIHLIIHNIEFFIKMYYEKYLKLFIIIAEVFAILSGLIFYKLNYSTYFVASWTTNFIIAPFFYGYFIIKKYEDSLGEVNFVEKILYTFAIILGVFFILVPYTRLFNLIGGGANSSVDKIAKVLLWILGLTYIFLNKMVMSFFYNKIQGASSN